MSEQLLWRGGGGIPQVIRWLLVYPVSISCYLLLKSYIFDIVEIKLHFLYTLLNGLSKIFWNTFYIWRERFYIRIICDSNISGNDDCAKRKPLLLICCVEWRNIKQLFSCFQIKLLKHKLRISIHFIFRHCFMLPFPPYSILLITLNAIHVASSARIYFYAQPLAGKRDLTATVPGKRNSSKSGKGGRIFCLCVRNSASRTSGKCELDRRAFSGVTYQSKLKSYLGNDSIVFTVK